MQTEDVRRRHIVFYNCPPNCRRHSRQILLRVHNKAARLNSNDHHLLTQLLSEIIENLQRPPDSCVTRLLGFQEPLTRPTCLDAPKLPAQERSAYGIQLVRGKLGLTLDVSIQVNPQPSRCRPQMQQIVTEC